MLQTLCWRPDVEGEVSREAQELSTARIDCAPITHRFARPSELHNQINSSQHTTKMSYYFAIIGTQDNPLFEYEFGTSKQGGDGIARFPEQARHMNQFIVHSSLDIVEEVQWGTGQMYNNIQFQTSLQY
jgi:hypothetical protein